MSTTQVPVKFPRPYAVRGSAAARNAEPSVTRGINLLEKPGLSWAAARETAMFAVHHRDEWEDLDPAEAVEVLRRHHRGVWDGRAAMGTLVHALNEAYVRGETVDLDAEVRRMAETEHAARGWRGREDEVIAQAVLYADGLDKFWQEWCPTECVSEEVVRTPGLYIGQCDMRCRLIDGRTARLDLKTTAEQDPAKAYYHDSWALQLAAYEHAPEVVIYGADEEGRPVEIGTEPNPAHDVLAVVHLRGDGDYELLEVDGSDETLRAFVELVHLLKWRRGLGECKPLTREGTP